MPSRTNLKLAEVIRQRAAHVLLHELKDPRMGFVTITHVKLAPDLTACRIFWSVLGGASERSKTSHALEHARGFVQRRVAEGLRLRNAPELSFEYDEAVEGAIKMGGLLKQLRTDRGEDPLGVAANGPEAEAEAGSQGADAAAADEDDDGDGDDDAVADDADADEEESGDTTDDEEIDADSAAAPEAEDEDESAAPDEDDDEDDDADDVEDDDDSEDADDDDEDADEDAEEDADEDAEEGGDRDDDRDSDQERSRDS